MLLVLLNVLTDIPCETLACIFISFFFRHNILWTQIILEVQNTELLTPNVPPVSHHHITLHKIVIGQKPDVSSRSRGLILQMHYKRFMVPNVVDNDNEIIMGRVLCCFGLIRTVGVFNGMKMFGRHLSVWASMNHYH